MAQIITIILMMALFFVLVTLAGTLATRNRRAVATRLEELNGSGAAAASSDKKQRRKKPKKAKSSKINKELERLEAELYDAGIRLEVSRFVMLWIVVTLLVPSLLLMLGLSWMVAAAFALLFAFGPVLYLHRARSKRRQELEGQLVEAIGLLCNALKSGHSFQSAMQNISRDMDGAISQEFGRVFRETQHGMSLEEGMNRMAARIESPDLEMLVSAITIQRQVGGNLAEVLQNISGTIQSRLDLKADIKARTSSGRVSGYIIGGLPLVLLAGLSVINPDYTMTLFITDTGRMMLLVGLVMEVIGFVVINKIVSVKY